MPRRWASLSSFPREHAREGGIGHLTIFKKDEKILRYDYNHGFKFFKIYNIFPQNAFIKSHKGDIN